MCRLRLGVLALLLLALARPACAQTREELLQENERLRARIAALEAAAAKDKAVIVRFDPATGKLTIKAGDKDRLVQLLPKTHVHDVDGSHVQPEQRAAKLKPGVPVEVVEEDGEVFSVNLGAGKHDHKHDHDDHDHKDDHAKEGEWRFHDPVKPGWRKPSDDYRPYSWMPPASEGFFKDLFCGQFIETHRNTAGTPWVHPFTIEPPQIHRDLFFFYKYAKDAEGGPADEHEAEVHLDWGLTRRFGILIAVPYLGIIGPDAQATGFGDLEIAPRIVLAEGERFFLATNLFCTIPTGDEERDLGRGETTFAPFLTTWHDLGCASILPWKHWNTAYTNFGPEFGLESGNSTFLYTVVFAHSFIGPKLIFPHQHGNGHGHGNGNGHAHGKGNGHGHGHQTTGGTISNWGPGYPTGLTNLILELNGQSELQDDRLTFLQLLTGFSYILTDSAEVRFGVDVPLNRPRQQFDARYLFGFSYIF